MQYTGLAGQIASWIILFTAYTIIAIGVFCLWYYVIFEVMIRYAMIALKIHRNFAEFIWYRKRFKKWLNKEQKAQECDATTAKSMDEPQVNNKKS